jgi:phage protein D
VISEIRDNNGNLLVTSVPRIEADAYDIRISGLLMAQMRRGDAIMIHVGYHGEPVMQICRGHDVYR